MIFRIIILLLISFIRCYSASVPIIIDTDIGPWPDDVGALAILHSAEDENLVQIKAIMANDRYEGIVPVIDALNTYFNRSSIPIGITNDPDAHVTSPEQLFWSNYTIENFPHSNYQKNDEAEDAVTLYRKILSKSDDKSIVILSIGFFNNLANLLNSKPDQYSNLTGLELVNEKVEKMIAMAGQFPEGKEWNIECQVLAAKKAIDKWPTPIIFDGFEIGEQIRCGKQVLQNKTNQYSPVYKAFEMGAEKLNDVLCFDEIAALIAAKGIEPYFTLIHGKIHIDSNGRNTWTHESHDDDGKLSKMAYIKLSSSVQEILNTMEPMLQR